MGTENRQTHARIGDERLRELVGCHAQCTEGAAAGHGLTLLHGGFDGSEETATATGHKVVAALNGRRTVHGVERCAGHGHRGHGLDWHKRLVGRGAERQVHAKAASDQ